MSLRGFHIFFIALATLFLLLLTGWSLSSYRQGGGEEALAMAAVGLVSAVTLAVYGTWFLRKINGSST